MTDCVSDTCITVTSSFDPFRAEPYIGDNGLVRIGHGHTIFTGKHTLQGERGLQMAHTSFHRLLEPADGLRILRSDLYGVDRLVRQFIWVDLSTHQRDALTILYYCLYQECGIPLKQLPHFALLETQGLIAAINTGNHDRAAELIRHPTDFVKRHARREAASNLYEKGTRRETCEASSLQSMMSAIKHVWPIGSPSR